MVLLWSLEFGVWKFISAAAICAVSPWRNKQRDVISRTGIRNKETNGDAIEKTFFGKIIADVKNKFVISRLQVVGREQWFIRPAVGIGRDGFNEVRGIARPKFDFHSGGGNAAHRIQHVSR